MNILVIGLGSMGRRRIRLIQKLDATYYVVGMDTNCERCKEVEKEYGISTVDSLKAAFNLTPFDCAVISTSPLSHNQLIKECLERELHVFTEINLVADGYVENQKAADDKGLILFLSSTFLYRKEVKYIQKIVRQSKNILHYRYHVGQYLSDWHPWESYKNFFVGDKRTNGCREIFAIELPWLVNTFGNILKVQGQKKKISSLEIDYPDSFSIIIEHESGVIGSMVVDIVSPKAIRNFEVFGEEIYLSWNGTPDGLAIYDVEKRLEKKISLYNQIDKLGEYSSNIIEDAYCDEIADFFVCIGEKRMTEYTFAKDAETLAVIDQIEQLD